ncbi:MAG: methyltransferase domain-containing protein [Alphaproteobacteria bacterium]|nr:methyltransferase domain-containing protein [Alphaproteobacteria bacterium]
MKKDFLNCLKCPQTGSDLTLEVTKSDGNEIIEGYLINKDGYKYKITDGLPDMIYDEVYVGDSVFARNYYTGISETYDEYLHITFDLYKDSPENTRGFMVNLLELKDTDNVLEVSAGTGKDSEVILPKITKGHLTLLDLTPAMLFKAQKNLEKFQNVDYVAGTALSLPFPDNYFDKLYCFTGVGHFPDRKRALKEMARVVKVGGRVVFSEKNIPLWLRDTTYGKICANNNPMFLQDAPLADIPVEARNLGIRWILGNVHYVVDYTVGDGEPTGNFDLEIPGARGGSFNTRYYGKLEGVTPETKKLALQAQQYTGKSMHKWLDELIKNEAEKILKEKHALD